jgi:hypothetical protein
MYDLLYPTIIVEPEPIPEPTPEPTPPPIPTCVYLTEILGYSRIFGMRSQKLRWSDGSITTFNLLFKRDVQQNEVGTLCKTDYL